MSVSCALGRSLRCTNAYLAQTQLDVELIRVRSASISTLLPWCVGQAAAPQTPTGPCPIAQGPARRCCGCGHGPVQRCNQQPPIEGLPSLSQAGLQALASRVDVQAARKSLAASRIAVIKF